MFRYDASLLCRYMYTDDQEQVQLIEKVYPSACADCCVDKADGEVCPQVYDD